MVEIKNNVIRATQGDTVRTQFVFEIEEGVPYEPSEGDRIRLAVKASKDPQDNNILVDVEIPITTMELVVPSSETKKLPYRRKPCFYDIEVTFAGGDVLTVISEGEWYSMPEVM
ncbi:MAG: hypothetical protein IJ899_20880 [Blautia sp.]|nr:hypothetical protein [Blautia sp.]